MAESLDVQSYKFEVIFILVDCFLFELFFFFELSAEYFQIYLQVSVCYWCIPSL